uniref:VPS9 domain-containing protein n=1 Tax=Plectus sambesii TaxID=2011161 RepID=A0A914UWH9_9BILA
MTTGAGACKDAGHAVRGSPPNFSEVEDGVVSNHFVAKHFTISCLGSCAYTLEYALSHPIIQMNASPLTIARCNAIKDSETKATLIEWTHKWRALEQWMGKVGTYADETFNFWRERCPQNDAYTTLKKPGRFVVSHDEKSSAECQVKLVQGTSGTNKTWQSLVVFNDSIAVIERKEYSLFEFPLVWVNPVTHDMKHLVRLLSPENDVTVEFSSAQAKTDFAQSAGLWRRRVPLEKTRDGTAALPVRRQGSHSFSAKHPTFSSCRYEGGWIDAKPHGSGKLYWPDGRMYIGRFRDGVIQGLGTMRVPVEGTAMVDGRRLVDTMTGVWKNGKLNGLALVQYASGSSYEGYMKESLKHGHGVLRASNSHNLYVGAWRDDKKQGYGVFSTQRERYLGMWFDDLRHGLGAVVTIDGVFHEGLFEKDRLVKGKLLCTDGTIYDGEFNGTGICNGKGTLYVTPSDKIEGMMFGNLLAAGQLKLSNAVYSKTTFNPGTPVTSSLLEDYDRSVLLNSSTWTVPADQKWTEMFEQFISEELGIPHGARPDTTTVWSAIAASMSKIKMADCSLGIAFDDRLEKVPTDVDAEWTAVYYEMGCDFWTMAMASKFHPLSRLVQGLVEVFASSYNNIAAHKSLVDHAVVEFRSIVRRTYSVMRYLFPSLPPESEMHSFVPLPIGEDRPSEIPPTACDFVLGDFLSRSYAVLQTVYAVGCEEMDARYWERATLLNTRSDVTLLDFLDVKRHLWPIEIQEGNVLDTPMICATAKKQYYKSAINTLQLLNSVFTPTAKLRVLNDTFAEVNKCVSLHASAGDKHVWNTDDLFPVFLFVVVRAQLQRLGATIRMIDDLTPQLNRLGQIELMFTTLKASYYQIIKEKSLP